MADFIIIAAVGAGLFLAIRTLAKGGGSECATCGSAGSCTSKSTGHCSVAQDMVARADQALGKR